VRLPCGVHGKTNHRVRLVECHADRLFKPADILEAAGTSMDAARSKAQASKHFMDMTDAGLAAEGVVDPVLEYLNNSGGIVSDNDEWVTVLCPWRNLHGKGGGETAGYKPLGRGERPLERVFRCHHDHCSKRNTANFLGYMCETVEQFEMLSVYDPSSTLVRDWVLDRSTKSPHNIETGEALKLDSFKEVYNIKQQCVTGMEDPEKGGEPTYAKKSTGDMWRSSLSRRHVAYCAADPLTEDLYPLNGKLRFLNTYRRCPYEPVEAADLDTDLVAKFAEFMDYLIPNAEERTYVMQWLASKIRKPAFRGNALLMVAKQEGTGRSTLFSIIEHLVGDHNVSRPDFDLLDSGWADWQEHTMVMIDEIDDADHNAVGRYTKLKSFIDPKPMKRKLNRKYGGVVDVKMYTSFMLATNGHNVLKIPDQARRFYVVTNASIRRPDEYFAALGEHLGDDLAPTWAPHLLRYFLAVDLAGFNGYAPAPRTTAMREMQTSTALPLDKACAAVLAAWPCDLISEQLYLNVLAPGEGHYDNTKWKSVASKKLHQVTQVSAVVARVWDTGSDTAKSGASQRRVRQFVQPEGRQVWRRGAVEYSQDKLRAALNYALTNDDKVPE
jgi:hypothetical protein